MIPIAVRRSAAICWSSIRIRSGSRVACSCSAAARNCTGSNDGFRDRLRKLAGFLVKRCIQNLLGVELKRFHAAVLAGTDGQLSATLHVTFVAPLPESHFFHLPDDASLMAKVTNGHRVFRHQHNLGAYRSEEHTSELQSH